MLMSVSAFACGCADNSMPVAQLPEIDKTNPLLADWDTPFATPPFDRIELAHYKPAFETAIAVSRAEIDAIVNNPAKPTFANTILALEHQGELLGRIEGIFFNLLEADASDEMQQIALEVQPALTELSNDVSLNPELFARVKAVYEVRSSDFQKRIKNCSKIPTRVSPAAVPTCPTTRRNFIVSIRANCPN